MIKPFLHIHLLFILGGCLNAEPVQPVSSVRLPDRLQVLEITRRATDWQLANPDKTHIGDWVQGPFLHGLLAVGQLPGNQKYIDEVTAIGQRENWGVISTPWKANDHCTPQCWLELYDAHKDPAMLEPIRKALDEIMAVTEIQDDNLDFKKQNAFKWSWCDALYMSPPTFARLAIRSLRLILSPVLTGWSSVSGVFMRQSSIING